MAKIKLQNNTLFRGCGVRKMIFCNINIKQHVKMCKKSKNIKDF